MRLHRHEEGITEISTCTAVYDALKERKFAGDFDRLLRWWQQNKVAQHQRLDAVDDLKEPQ